MNNDEIIKKHGATGSGVEDVIKCMNEARADERAKCKTSLEKVLSKLNAEMYSEEPYETWQEFKEHQEIITEATGVKNLAVLIEEIVHETSEASRLSTAKAIFEELDTIRLVENWSSDIHGKGIPLLLENSGNYQAIKKKYLAKEPKED